jgi:hypothetical protein
MPKRIIDGEGLWRSDKLLQVDQRWRAEYANLLPLALANGTFEVNPRRIWSQVYSYNRFEITTKDVGEILASFEKAKLLFRWTDQASGKEWGYWTGSREKPGRLPPSSRRGSHEPIGPEPPAEELQRFTDSVGQPPASQGLARGFGESGEKEEEFCNTLKTGGQPLASQTEANGCLGLGLGLGIGIGSGTDSNGIRKRSQLVEPPKFNPTEVAQILCQKNGWSGKGVILALENAVKFQAAQSPEMELEEIGESLVAAYFAYKSSKADFASYPQRYFEQGLYANGGKAKPQKGSSLLERTLAMEAAL